MNNLLPYDFEKGTLEYIYKISGTKSTKIKFLVKVKDKVLFSLLLANIFAIPA